MAVNKWANCGFFSLPTGLIPFDRIFSRIWKGWHFFKSMVNGRSWVLFQTLLDQVLDTDANQSCEATKTNLWGLTSLVWSMLKSPWPKKTSESLIILFIIQDSTAVIMLSFSTTKGKGSPHGKLYTYDNDIMTLFLYIRPNALPNTHWYYLVLLVSYSNPPSSTETLAEGQVESARIWTNLYLRWTS